MDDYSTMIQVLTCIGACFAYFICLIFATCLTAHFFRDGCPDDIDYAMAANIIQFSIMIGLIIWRILLI